MLLLRSSLATTKYTRYLVEVGFASVLQQQGRLALLLRLFMLVCSMFCVLAAFAFYAIIVAIVIAVAAIVAVARSGIPTGSVRW